MAANPFGNNLARPKHENLAFRYLLPRNAGNKDYRLIFCGHGEAIATNDGTSWWTCVQRIYETRGLDITGHTRFAPVRMSKRQAEELRWA